MASRKVVLGIWTSRDIVVEVDRRRGPLSRSAYLNLILKEAFAEGKSIEVMYVSTPRRQKLAMSQKTPVESRVRKKIVREQLKSEDLL